MLPVAGDPLLSHNRGRKPQPYPHRKSGEVVELHPAMSLSAVKEQCHGHVGQVSSYYHENDRLPPRRRPASKIRHYVLRYLSLRGTLPIYPNSTPNPNDHITVL